MKPDRESMSKVDTAWLRMERPTNLMIIMGILILEGKLNFRQFKKLIETRFLKYKRFMQRPVQEGRHAYWEDDPYFDSSRHIHRTALPGKAGKEELEELASDLRSTPFDFSKPLWQFHLVENYEQGTAVIVRIHHCYADGIALIKVVMSMTDSAEETDEASSEDEEEHSIFHHLFDPVNELVSSTLKLGRGLLDEITHPFHVLNYARQGAEMALEIAKVALTSNDPETFFKGKLCVSKKVAWSEPLSLKEVKTVGQVLGCSVNDVVLAAVSGALRAYLIEKGDKVEGIEIRAAVPVNLRPINEVVNLGNHFGLVFLRLPLGVANPLERLYQVKRYMQELKGSYQALASFGLLGVLGFGPNSLEQPALDLLTKKATAVMSNVPGPQQAIHLAGSMVEQMMFWVPQSGEIGMGVSILSYNGKVQFGLITDERLVSEPQSIANRFASEFEKLLLVTLMDVWGKQPTAHSAEEILKPSVS